jgi:hypothetical protein
MVLVITHKSTLKTTQREKTLESVNVNTIVSCTGATKLTHPKFNG